MLKDRTPNRCLWMLKGISCIIVVLMHCTVSHPLSRAVSFGLRFPLPVFYMISGYYSYRKDNVLVYVRKLLCLILGGELLAGIVTEILYRLGADNAGALQILAGLNIPKTLFFGTVFNGNLWYLYTTAWAWVVFWFLKKKDLFRWAYVCIIPLLAIPIVIKLTCGAFLKLEGFTELASHYDYLFRIIFLYGLPFMLLGHWMAEHREAVLKRISVRTALLMIAAGFALDAVEYTLIHYYMEMQFSTIIITVGLFLLALAKPDFAPAKGLTFLGRELSTMVYVIHLPILWIVRAVLTARAPEYVDSLLYPAAGVALTVGISLAVRTAGRHFHAKK